MSCRTTIWWSPTVLGYWLHVYNHMYDDCRRLVIESDRTGREIMLWRWHRRRGPWYRGFITCAAFGHFPGDP